MILLICTYQVAGVIHYIQVWSTVSSPSMDNVFFYDSCLFRYFGFPFTYGFQGFCKVSDLVFAAAPLGLYIKLFFPA
jgi:hypothetical protein